MNVIRNFTRRVCLLTTCALAVGLPAAAKAQTVLIDFGNNGAQYRGLPVPNPDPKGHFWNSIQPGLLVTDMVDFNNNPTMIDLGWSTPVGTDSYNGPAGPTEPAPPAFPTYASFLPLTDIDTEALGNLGVLEAAFDFAASPLQHDTRARFDLQGLDPTKSYTLTFFGSHKYSTDPVTVYSVYSDSAYTNLLGTTSLEVVDPLDPTAHNRDKVATISNISPAVDVGILYVQFVGSTGNLGYLNDMQIESSTTVLAGDYNGNGKVDAADYVAWRKNPSAFGGPGGYTTWRANFGRMAGAGSQLAGGTVVPEPASLMIAIGAAMGLFWIRRWR